MKPTRIAIVGGGPRGLAALESLIRQLASREVDNRVEVAVFEASDYPGCGPNYAPDQLLSNQLNIPLREIPMAARRSVDGPLSVPPFRSFRAWYRDQIGADRHRNDHYPPRAQIGRYLQTRFQSIVDANSGNSDGASLAVYSPCEVTALRRCGDAWRLETSDNPRPEVFEEVLLSIGHQPNETDPALARWSRQGTVFAQPYPCEPIRDSAAIDTETVVAVRGMGLSMIDVVKSLTLGRGGRLVTTDASRLEMKYLKSGNEPRLMLPFSLDGQPLAPKPLNRSIDSWFTPDRRAHDMARRVLGAVGDLNRHDEPVALLKDLVARVGASVYMTLRSRAHATMPAEAGIDAESELTLVGLSRAWLSDERFQHRLITDRHQPASDQLRTFLQMATGHRLSSLDYCIGQVWRHLQPLFYSELRLDRFSGDEVAEVLALHQRMKRFAFGPPAAGTATLLALVDAGLLKFCIADDPDIEMGDGYWRLYDGQAHETAQVMLNTVLDSPILEKIDSPLVRALRAHALVEPVHEQLGAKASADGRLLCVTHSIDSLCAAGRLITGTVFEADALCNCFGDEIDSWAGGVVQRVPRRVAATVD